MSKRLSVIFDNRWIDTHGIGRFAHELQNRIPGMVSDRLDGNPLSPLDCLKLSRCLLRRDTAFFSPGFNPPLRMPWGRKGAFVFTIHDLIHINFPAESSFVKRVFYRFVARTAVHKAFRVLTNSEYSKKEICEWSGVDPSHVEVVYCGVADDFKKEGPVRSADRDYLLYVGNQKPHKNVDGLLEAFSLTLKEHDYDLAISGNAKTETEKKIRDLGLQDRVHFLGKLPDAELAAAYRGARWTLLPSKYEGFGLPIVESMACGTPVVCSNVTSMPEIAGDAALLVATDPESIAAGIRAALQMSPQEREGMIKKGFRQAATFTWEKTAERVAAVIDELAVCRPRGGQSQDMTRKVTAG